MIEDGELADAVSLAAARQSRWSPELASVISWTTTLLDRTLETSWDAAAGEKWISLRSTDRLIGIVSTAIPLAVLTQDLGTVLPFPIVTIVCDAPARTPVLRLGPLDDRSANALPGLSRLRSDIDGPFSMQDLWFYTV